jgi:signal transduction histidine kinase/DNA-binding response OmpR family regulator
MVSLKIKLFIFSFSLLAACGLKSQDFIVKARLFGVEHGLPHRQVNDVLQDRRGFIWVATKKGLAKFDGHRFEVFDKRRGGLANDYVGKLAEDANGNILVISTFLDFKVNSIDVIDPISGRITPNEVFIKQVPDKIQDRLNVFYPPTYTKTAEGWVYFGVSYPAGIAAYHPQKGWRIAELENQANARILKLTSKNTCWLFTHLPGDLANSRLIEMDLDGKVYHNLPVDDGIINPLVGVASMPDNFYIIQTKKNILEIWEDGRATIAKPFNPANKSLGIYSQLADGQLFLQGNSVMDKDGNTLLKLDQKFPQLTGYPGTVIIREKDNPSHYWVSTPFGLLMLDVRPNRFKRYLHKETANSIEKVTCRGLFVNNGKLFVNSDQMGLGRHMVDLKTGNVTLHKSEKSFGIGLSPDGKLYADESSLGSSIPNLVLMDPTTNLSTKIADKKIFYYTWSFFFENADRILLGNGAGISVYVPSEHKLTELSSSKFPEAQLANVIWMEADSSGGGIWACSDRGLFKIKDGNVMEHYWTGGTGQFEFPTNNIHHIYEDKDGVLWLGTGGDGLLRWDRKTGEKTQIQGESGLLNDFIYAVYEDKHGHLWMPTDYGIAQFDKKSLKVRRTWLPDDGIAQAEFNRIAHFQDKDGTLYFGGLNGVTAFHPDDFYEVQANVPMNLVVSKFERMDGSTGTAENLTADLLKTGKILMKPNDRFIQLDFALLEFSNSENIAYEWQIEGVDAGWNRQSEPSLRFSSLPYGKHRLRIRAQAADGSFSKEEIALDLVVLRPVYLRWWFLLLLAALLVAGTWLWLRNRTRQHQRLADVLQQEVVRQTATIRQQAEELKEIDAFKNRVYANITHELRTPLTVILGVAELAEQDLVKLETERSSPIAPKVVSNPLQPLRNNVQLIIRNGKNLLGLVNQLLDLSKAQSNKLTLEMVQGDVRTYLMYLVDGFAGLASQNRIQLRASLPVGTIMMDYDPEKLRQIVSNLLSNAIKHTPEGGTVELGATVGAGAQTKLCIHVKDTGVGIAPDDLPKVFDRFFQGQETSQAGGTGIGLALVKELTKLHGGNVEAESKLGEGSTFKVCLPITNNMPMQPEHPQPDVVEGIPLEMATAPMLASADVPALPSLLIVEDNPDVSQFLKSFFEGKYHLHFAANGRTGIEQALEVLPDLILTDLMMPEMDGLQLCEALKTDERTSHLPIVMLTARVDVESRLAGLRRGADAYLGKPFNQTELELVLGNLLASQERLRQRYQLKLTESSPEAASPMVSDGVVESATTSPSPEDLFMEKVNQIMSENLADSRLTLEDMCRKIGMNRTYLNAKMMALTGMSTMQYLRAKRMLLAKQLLLNPGLTVADVATEVGFDDPKYFSRVFSEEFGTTPQNFRRP